MSNTKSSSNDNIIENSQINDFSNKKNITKADKYYIRHIDNTDKIYCLNNSWHNSLFLMEVIESIIDDYGSENNPIVLNNVIKECTMEFIVNYLNYYGKQTETKPPETPLPEVHISEIFGDEYKLFKNIFDEKNNMGDNLKNLSDFINSSNYFNIEFLTKKLCAIIAYLLKEYKGDLQKIISNK